MSFLTRLECSELRVFVQLMFRSIIPRDKMMHAALSLSASSSSSSLSSVSKSNQQQHLTFSQHCEVWYTSVEEIAFNITPKDIETISWERQTGYLHLLEHAIKILGFRISDYTGLLCKMVFAMLTNAQNKRSEFLESGVNNEAQEEEKLMDDENVAEDAEDDEDGTSKNTTKDLSKYRSASQSTRIRTLCLLRVSGILLRF